MASEPQMAGIFDALPYYDDDLQKYSDLKKRAEEEIARERGPQSSTMHPRVPPEFQLSIANPLLAAELERVRSHQPFAPIDSLRYQLPAPTSNPGTDEEWQASLDNAHAQLEHQRVRQTNLALLQNYGPNAWRVHNYLLEATAKNLEKELEENKQRTVEVNRERKNGQERIGKQLSMLETRWTELISNVLQIEMANVALEGEVEGLRKKEEELQSMIGSL